MRDDWATYRGAIAWLRDFADQKNIFANEPRTVSGYTTKNISSAQSLRPG